MKEAFLIENRARELVEYRTLENVFSDDLPKGVIVLDSGEQSMPTTCGSCGRNISLWAEFRSGVMTRNETRKHFTSYRGSCPHCGRPVRHVSIGVM